jgi:capsular polysaccharide biosynthesis protein
MELSQSDESAPVAAGTGEAAAQPPAAEVSTPGVSTPGVSTAGANMLAHISMRGNVEGHAGSWLGEPGSGLSIEAIMLAPAAAGPPHLSPAVECQIIYPLGIKTPWTLGGQPCGSAGFGLACIGMRFRLSAETAPFFDCRYDIAFADGTRQEDVPGAEIALAPSGAAVEGIRLHVVARPATPLIVLNDVADQPGADEAARDADPAIALRLLSPSFVTRVPDILNAALIPAASWQAMAISFNRRVFGGRTVTLRLIPEAIVAGQGLVFDHNLNLVPGTDRKTPDAEVEHYRSLAREGRGAGLRRIAGMTVVCKTRSPHNFGHFLVDMFPKAWLATRLLDRRHFNYVVQETDLLPVVREAFTRIGVNPFAISVTDDMPVLCESALVIDGLSHHGIYQSPICVQALSDLAAPIPAAPYAKVFVSRQAQDRLLLNQEAVEAVMRGRGFAIVDPGRMTLAEQISLFKGATTVVGPLGAALTNIAFCPRGSRVVALTAQSFPDTLFWFLSQHCGHDYREVRGLDASGTPEEHGSWNAGFTISEEDIATLAAL